MERQVNLSRKETATRKANGSFKRDALLKISAELQKTIFALKDAYYTSPAAYGIALANRPRHAHAGGRRVLHVTNF